MVRSSLGRRADVKGGVGGLSGGGGRVGESDDGRFDVLVLMQALRRAGEWAGGTVGRLQGLSLRISIDCLQCFREMSRQTIVGRPI
jgi:hypothetical protein